VLYRISQEELEGLYLVLLELFASSDLLLMFPDFVKV
jgi:hypothetical protein